MLDWLIVGGGIHGVHLAIVLTNGSGIDKKGRAVRVVDPHRSLLAHWHATTANVGMSYLRSPRVHHVDLSANSLHELACAHRDDPGMGYAPPYYRPSLTLFDRHCANVIETRRLEKMFISDSVRRIEECRNGLRAECDSGKIRARKVFLCVGSGAGGHWPVWADGLRDNGAAVHHIFEDVLSTDTLGDHTCIVGGGLTAIQTALRCADAAPGRVSVISRHPLRIHQFDSDPGWIGPKYLAAFHAVTDYSERRKIIDHARYRGSVSEDIATALRNAIADRKLRWMQAKIVSASGTENDRIRIDVEGLDPGSDEYRGSSIDHSEEHSRSLLVSGLWLATGYNRTRPGGALVDRLIHDYSLPCAPCGYPILSSSLQWHPRIHVSGRLAELEVGPVSANIAGARLAGRRTSGFLD